MPEMRLPVFECPQCGLMHPPLQEGTSCPMKKETTKDGTEIDVSSFLSQMKVVLVGSIKKKEIKNIKRLIGQTVVHLTKFLDQYSE